MGGHSERYGRRKIHEDHHVLFHRSQHESNEDSKWVRRNAGLLVPMDIDVHDELHAKTPGVPPLDIYMVRRVKSIMRKNLTPDPIRNIDTYCWAIEEAMGHPKAYEVEKAVGNAAIQAVRMQLPFIREGIVPVV